MLTIYNSPSRNAEREVLAAQPVAHRSISPDKEAESLVTVIVPCYNSERTIRHCLNAITTQMTSTKFDVIVVDSSSDRTGEIVESEFPSVRLIKLRKRTFAGAARNAGIRATRAQYCLMIDSDCVAQPDVIEKAVARHLEGEYAAVGGALCNGTPRSVSGWIGYLLEFKEFMPSTPLRLEKSVPTANVAYRREALERHGYFDEDMWLAEDILLNWRIFSSGERILFDPAIQVTHLNRTGWRQILTYQISLGKLSAEARRRSGLSGTILLKYPALILLMPFARLMRAIRWLATYDRRAMLVLVLIWPLYFIAASFWSFGFFQGVRNKVQNP